MWFGWSLSLSLFLILPCYISRSRWISHSRAFWGKITHQKSQQFHCLITDWPWSLTDPDALSLKSSNQNYGITSSLVLAAVLGFPFFSSFHALSLADKDLPTCELGRSSNLRFQQKIWHSCINVISSIENASIYQNWSQIRKTLSADKEQTYFVWIRPTHIDFIGRWRKQCSIVCFCCLIFPGHSLWKAKKMNEYHHSFDFINQCLLLNP